MAHQDCTVRFSSTALLPLALLALSLPAGSSAAEIAIDAGVSVGSSNDIARVLAVEGGPLGTSRFETRAWRAIGLDTYIGLFDEPGGAGMHVTRGSGAPGSIGPLGPGGDLYLDTSDFDGYVRSLDRTYGTRPQLFTASQMPRAMSLHPELDDFETYAPRSDAEWDTVMRAAVIHMRDKLGISSPIVQVSSEPESDNWAWNGRNKDDPRSEKLRAYVDFFIVTWYAVEAANPRARTIGPGSAVYSSALAREISGIPDVWGMEEFLALLYAHNLAHPDNPVVLECVGWQGYDWLGSRRIRVGASFVQDELERNGFSRQTPQIIIGWNAQWTGGEIPLWYEASHFASNAIDLLYPGGDRPVERMYFYTYNLDDQECDGTGPRNYASLITTVHPAYELGSGRCIPASNVQSKRPGYAAFEALHSMLGGVFVQTTVPDAGPGEALIDAMATRNGTRTLKVLLANNSDSDGAPSLRVSNVPWRPGTRVTVTLQRVDNSHSVDGGGLERGVRLGQLRVAADRSVTITADSAGPLPTRSVRLLTITTRR